MEHASRPMTWYVSRRVELPLAAAATALDELIAPQSGRSAFGRLRLGDRRDRALPGLIRRLPGRLSLGDLGRPARVELELTAWSHRESELGLRPIKPVISLRATRFGATAAAVLEQVRTELVSRGTSDGDELRLRRAS